jgi:hypothetical protein
VASCCVRGNEPCGFIKCGKFLNVMRNSEPMNKSSPSWRQSWWNNAGRQLHDEDPGHDNGIDQCYVI